MVFIYIYMYIVIPIFSWRSSPEHPRWEARSKMDSMLKNPQVACEEKTTPDAGEVLKKSPGKSFNSEISWGQWAKERTKSHLKFHPGHPFFLRKKVRFVGHPKAKSIFYKDDLLWLNNNWVPPELFFQRVYWMPWWARKTFAIPIWV